MVLPSAVTARLRLFSRSSCLQRARGRMIRNEMPRLSDKTAHFVNQGDGYVTISDKMRHILSDPSPRFYVAHNIVEWPLNLSRDMRIR